MRFDTPVYFQTIIQGEYDAKTGNYAEDTVEEELIYCDVTQSSLDTMNLLYGQIKQDSLIVRTKRTLSKGYSFLRIGEKRYRIDTSRVHLGKQSLMVSEVQQ